MSFPKAKTIISICKYGVLHFEFYSQNEKNIILKTLLDLCFKQIDSCIDPVEFDNFNARKLKISS